MDYGLVWAWSTCRAPKAENVLGCLAKTRSGPRPEPARPTHAHLRSDSTGWAASAPCQPDQADGFGPHPPPLRECVAACELRQGEATLASTRAGLGRRRRDLLTPGMFDRRTSSGPPKDEGLAPNTTGSDPLGHAAAASAASQIEEANRYGGGKRA